MTLLVTATTGGLMDLATVSLHIASLWPRPVTVIEADPDGGRLAARHDWDVRPGLVELAAALRSHVSGDFDRASVVRTYSAQVSVVVAPPAAEPVMAALTVLATRTAEIESLVGTDVIVDVGRVRPDSPANALVAAADRRLLVTRTDLEDIVSVVHRGDHLRSLGAWSVLAGGGRYGTSEVDRAIEWPVIADLLPDNPKSSSKLRKVVASLADEPIVALAEAV